MLIFFGDFTLKRSGWHWPKCFLIKYEVRHKKYCSSYKCNHTVLFHFFDAQMHLAPLDHYLHEAHDMIEA